MTPREQAEQLIFRLRMAGQDYSRELAAYRARYLDSRHADLAKTRSAICGRCKLFRRDRGTSVAICSLLECRQAAHSPDLPRALARKWADYLATLDAVCLLPDPKWT